MKIKIRNIKSFIIAIIGMSFIFYSFTLYASMGKPYNKIVFFGDSLSDNGNLYSTDIGFMPKSPPYFGGRFSNGEVWSEYVAQYLYTKGAVNEENFAVGGETAIFHNPFSGFLPFSLTASLNSYLLRTYFRQRDRETSLFVIWVGANDYLNGTSENQVQALTTKVAKEIKYVVESLIANHATNFLIINLPDFSKTPYAKEEKKEKILGELATIHNIKLTELVSELQLIHPEINIHIYDLNRLFVDLMAHPEIYNKKYGIHITNTTQACWQGGYTSRKNTKEIDEKQIQQQLENYIQSQSGFIHQTINADKEVNIKGLAHYIRVSPTLREAYWVSESASKGILPCANPDEYIFWDHVHPTAIVHTLLSKDMIDFINRYYPNYYSYNGS